MKLGYNMHKRGDGVSPQENKQQEDKKSRRRRILCLMITVILLMTLTGCQAQQSRFGGTSWLDGMEQHQTEAEGESAADAAQKDSDDTQAEGETVNVVDWDFLLAAEDGVLSDAIIAEINRLFQPAISQKEGARQPNPNCLPCFVSSFYDRPADMDLLCFLRDCPVAETAALTAAEKNALAASPNWISNLSVDELPVPTKKYAEDRINALLGAYLDITLQDLSAENREQVLYLDAYKAYYEVSADFWPGDFRCVSGEKRGEKVILSGNTMGDIRAGDYHLWASVLTLVEKEGRYVISSHQKTT